MESVKLTLFSKPFQAFLGLMATWRPLLAFFVQTFNLEMRDNHLVIVLRHFSPEGRPREVGSVPLEAIFVHQLGKQLIVDVRHLWTPARN